MKYGFYTIEHRSPGLFPPLESAKSSSGLGETHTSLIYIFDSKPDNTYQFEHIKYFTWNNKRKKWELGVKKRDDTLLDRYKLKEFKDRRFIIKTIFKSKSLSNSFVQNIGKIK